MVDYVIIRISIHAPAKGATFAVCYYDFALEFQSTLPRRERQRVISFRLCSTNFNPRSREGSDVLLPYQSMTHSQFQSTLPRRERQGTIVSFVFDGQISIHAPAKGATIKPSAIPSDSIISIHAPAKGATAPGVPEYNVIIIFQSTLPRRERLDTMTKGKEVVIISIHAPAKGATF